MKLPRKAGQNQQGQGNATIQQEEGWGTRGNMFCIKKLILPETMKSSE